MIKKLVLVFIAFIAIQSYAQQGTASPYSFYGIGALKFKGTVENRSMGGLSIYTDSIHVNLRNPASYASPNVSIFPYNKESRPVKFSVGGSHSSIKLKSDSSSESAASSSFDYLAISIPLNKFGVGFGIRPHSAVGYKLETTTEDDKLYERFRGQGGVNKAFLSLGYQVAKGLSIGVDANYNFGNIQNYTIEFLYDSQDEVTTYQTREDSRSDLSGLNFNLGLSYKTMISDKLELITGLTYAPESTLTSINERSFSTITISNTEEEFVINTIDGQDNLIAAGLDKTELVMPSKFSIGAGIGQPRIWFIGAEYTSLKASNFSNALFENDNTSQTYEDASGFSLGGFYIPKYNSFTSYLKRVVYRAGVRFQNTGLKINNESINEFGMSFGVGLPIGNLFSNANLGLEIGKRGTVDNNLIQENFINFQISLSLNDRWFNKRKYN